MAVAEGSAEGGILLEHAFFKVVTQHNIALKTVLGGQGDGAPHAHQSQGVNCGGGEVVGQAQRRHGGQAIVSIGLWSKTRLTSVDIVKVP